MSFSVTQFSTYSAEETPATTNSSEPTSSKKTGTTSENTTVSEGIKLNKESISITLKQGETKTEKIVITNTGNIPHDFTLGDQATQDEHAAEMAEMIANGEAAHDSDNAVVLAPGETKELTWYFSEAGTFIVGCHQPGHYAAGMVGAVNVEA